MRGHCCWKIPLKPLIQQAQIGADDPGCRFSCRRLKFNARVRVVGLCSSCDRNHRNQTAALDMDGGLDGDPTLPRASQKKRDSHNLGKAIRMCQVYGGCLCP